MSWLFLGFVHIKWPLSKSGCWHRGLAISRGHAGALLSESSSDLCVELSNSLHLSDTGMSWYHTNSALEVLWTYSKAEFSFLGHSSSSSPWWTPPSASRGSAGSPLSAHCHGTWFTLLNTLLWPVSGADLMAVHHSYCLAGWSQRGDKVSVPFLLLLLRCTCNKIIAGTYFSKETEQVGRPRRWLRWFTLLRTIGGCWRVISELLLTAGWYHAEEFYCPGRGGGLS